MSITAYEYLSILQTTESNGDANPHNFDYLTLLEKIRATIAERHSKELAAALDSRAAAKTLKALILQYCVEFLAGTGFEQEMLVEKIYLDKIFVSAMANKQYSYVGHRRFAKMKRWNKTDTDLWSLFPMPQLLRIASRLAYVDEAAEITLQKQLTKAGLSDTPREYTGKKYILILLGTALSALCAFAKFYLGIILAVLVIVFLMLKLRDTIADKIKAKDLEISSEMPRFVRTICRSLQTDRDLVRVIASYRIRISYVPMPDS